jgi:SAM-dependent methyltransferase
VRLRYAYPMSNVSLKPLMSSFYGRGLTATETDARTVALYEQHEDPWDLATEDYRFAETNRLITNRFGRVGRLLEIGAGEGHQTRWLTRVADHVTGIDLSPAALERARMKAPDATFAEARLPELELPADVLATGKHPTSAIPFDIAVACEVLYFADDIGQAVTRMRQLAPRGLVTGLESKWRRFGPAVANLPALHMDRIVEADTVWLVAVWDESSVMAPDCKEPSA